MIEFHYETSFSLANETNYRNWLEACIITEGCTVGDINYIFCSDDYLHKINLEYLNHDTLTDIISFDNTVRKRLQGDIFISVDRVKDNANDFRVSFKEELLRVMAHGVLHFAGYKDKTEADAKQMRLKEEEKIKMFHVEQ